jgi:hypothetical protein
MANENQGGALTQRGKKPVVEGVLVEAGVIAAGHHCVPANRRRSVDLFRERIHPSRIEIAA